MGLFTEREPDTKNNNMKSIALILNGFAAGWLLSKSGFTLDCIIAFTIIGISTIYLLNKNRE